MPACLMMLLSVPAANSCLRFPATVTRPGFLGCLYWRWLPDCATWNHPSSRSSLITSRTFMTKIPYRRVFALESYERPSLDVFLVECGHRSSAGRSACERIRDMRQIYVYLEGEGTDVWRPVEADHLGGDTYRITSESNDRDDEHWRFSPGDLVRCEVRMLSNSKPHRRLVAIEKVTGMAEHIPPGDTPEGRA